MRALFGKFQGPSLEFLRRLKRNERGGEPLLASDAEKLTQVVKLFVAQFAGGVGCLRNRAGPVRGDSFGGLPRGDSFGGGGEPVTRGDSFGGGREPITRGDSFGGGREPILDDDDFGDGDAEDVSGIFFIFLCSLIFVICYLIFWLFMYYFNVL